MKKIIVFIFMNLFVVTTIFSQNFSIGAKYAGNSTWLLNKQVSADENQSYSMSFGHDFGIITHLKFSDYVGIKAEILANTTNQKYKGVDSLDLSYENNLKLQTIDVPIYMTFGNKFYVEIGYIISVLNKAEQELSIENFSSYDDVKSNFSQVNQSVSLGLVKCFEFGEGFRFLIGVRASRGIKNIEGVNAFGESQSDLEEKLGDDFNSENFSTKSLTVGAYFGLTIEL
jgi:hypothetical protein